MLFGNGVACVGKVPNCTCFGRTKIIAVSDERLIVGKPDLMIKRSHTDAFACGAAFRANLFGFGGCIGGAAAIRHRCILALSSNRCGKGSRITGIRRGLDQGCIIGFLVVEGDGGRF